VINNLHWIQALTGTRRGAAVPTILDNDLAHPFESQSAVSPYYGGGGPNVAAGTLAGGGGWFVDRPLINENEYEGDPVASVQFQVVLASDTRSVVNGVTQNALTFYGGEWWGFTYTAADIPTPEPGSLTLLGTGALGLFRYGRRRSKHTAA
jgi:hypothetical protein